MRRRNFVAAALGALACSVAARAQQGERRRVGVLMNLGQGDREGEMRLAALRQALQQLGWIEPRAVSIDARWSGSDAARIRRDAAALLARAPDVIVAAGSVTTGPLLQATRTVPIVFVHVSDPVGAGYVDSLSRPGGNATGFMFLEYGATGKWLELLKEMAPSLTRVGVIRDPTLAVGIGQFGAIQAVAPSLGVDVSAINVRDGAEIERAITSFAGLPNGGLIVTASALALAHGDLIVGLAARHRLPAIYFERYFLIGGGLMTYAPDLADQFRLAGGYVDRILKGEKPADLPVQAPTKYELVINLKAATALGLVVPQSILARADEVIE